MENEKNRKKIAYWGTGEVCKNCLYYHRETVPDFFIDSFSTAGSFEGKAVKRPEEIRDFRECFIVVVIDNYQPVRDLLTEKGLTEGLDFCYYREYFGKKAVVWDEFCEKLNRTASGYDQGKKNLLMFLCVFVERQSIQRQKFFAEYIRKHRDRYNITVVSNLGSVNEDDAADIMGCDVIDQPALTETVSGLAPERERLSDSERGFVEEITARKCRRVTADAVREEENKYVFYRAYVDRLKPDHILIWGGWTSEFYYIRQLSLWNHITYRVMEHGAVPGTIIADPEGIMGQSVFGRGMGPLDEIEVLTDYYETYCTISRYVTDNQLDTRKFLSTDFDKTQLSRLDRSKKTVFLVGMDEKGMSINPASDYFNTYISDTYHTMEEAVCDILGICEKQGWNLIYKPHPGNPLDNPGLMERGLIYVENYSIDSLIKMSDVVVSMSSAVEFKVPMYKKPLIQIGYSLVWDKGCSYCLRSKTDMEKTISEALRSGLTKEQEKNYARFIMRLLKRYLWDDGSEREIRYGLPVDVDFFEENI